MPSSNTRICPVCATVVPAGFPEGLCPKCLLTASLAPDPERPQIRDGEARPGGVPSVEMLRGLFPELEILDVLGVGGMGAVYEARQPRLNRRVALKIMVCPQGHEADFALRFEREAQVLARLNHPHIVILYDFGELGTERTGADPLFYFLMEYVDGTDLGQIIKARELKPDQALAIVPQICEALQYAHDQGITHRDIKPANILLDKRGVVKIADFGLAKMIRSGAEETLLGGLTQTGTAMGTPHYMAPEQWEHPEQVDHRVDIYALGVVFYEMLTGERPAGVFQPPSKKTKPPVDKKLDGVVMRAMDKNPERRYQRAGQIGDDVTRISGANKHRPASGKDGTEAGRPRLKLLLAFGAVAALAAGGGFMWQGSGRAPEATPQVLGDAQPRYMGRLRGGGVLEDGRPLDLKKAEGITDFVQVILTNLSWVGLRANGEQVISDSGWVEKDIARLLPSFFNSYGTIDRQGHLSILKQATEGVKAIPEEVQRIGVVDAQWNDGCAIALLKDGTARVWGEVYEGPYKGMPVWPMPPAEALRDVTDIAAPRAMSATLTADGRLHSWGGDKETGHYALRVPAGNAKLEEIESRWNWLWVRDAAGLVFRVSPRQKTLDAATQRDLQDIAGITALPRQGTAWTWCDPLRTNVQAEVDARLKQIGNRPRDGFDLRVVGPDEASMVAAIWIEPVAQAAAPQESAVRPWVGAFPDPAKLPGLVESRDGWVLSDHLTVTVRTPSGGEMELLNAGLRARMRFSEGGGSDAAQLILRRGSRGGDHFELRYYRNLTGDRPNQFQIRHWDHKLKQSTMLAGVEVAEAAHEAAEGFVLEFYAIGSRLHGRLNGAHAISADVPDAAFVNPGEAGFAKLKDCWLTDMEILHLDGLSEAEALKVAGLGGDEAGESGRGDDPAGAPWENLLDDPEMKSSLHPTAAGYEARHWATVEREPGRDGAIRCRLLYDGKPNYFRLVALKQDKGWYQAYLMHGGGMIQYVDSELPVGKFKDLPEVETSRLPAALEPGQEVELELRVHGESLEFRVNGQVVCTGRDMHLGPGRWGFCNNSETPVTIRSLDFQNASSLEPGAGGLPSTGLTLKALIHGGSRYTIIQEDLSWPDARRRAEELGRKLVVFEDKAEEQAVRAHFRAFLGQGCWIGGHAEEGSPDIRWLSGNPVGKGSWAVGHPSWRTNKDSGGAQAEGLLWAAGLVLTGQSVQIQPQGRTLGFICEQPADASGRARDTPGPPGRLHGTGTLLSGKTLDLTRCGAFDDFVDVAGSYENWVALRANGDTLSSDGKADFQGIRRIARSYQGGYPCFIDMAGGLRFHPLREMVLPSSLKGRVIVDAACGSHHGLALLEGGQAVVFGRRYEEAMEDSTQVQGVGTPRWPQPDPAALQNVKGVAVTQTHAATLHHDGTVSVWGWEGAVKWQPEMEMKPVRQIASFHDALHLLDEAGQVWSFPLPRSSHPQQPVGFDGRVKRLAGAAARLREHFWLRQDGTWGGVEADRPTMEMLASVRLRPETNFALLASIAGAKPFGYVLWIEPVVEAKTTRAATKDTPFVNSLGMKFVPVPITGGPTDGQRVLFSIWETRLQDFQTFSRETKLSFGSERFAVGPDPTHPVATVTWDEAQAFCSWLTERERKDGKLGAGGRYRLPSDHEWSCAVGIGEREDVALSPKEKSGKLLDVHPWGTAWPPSERSGNFASEELRPLLAEARYDYIKSVIPSYQDGHATLAPVGSYPANALGLFDLAGNVFEWCEDWFDSRHEERVYRGGGSWSSFDRREMLSAKRGAMGPLGKVSATGFRVVLASPEPGGPGTLPAVKPGRLRASGTTANGKPHDLTKFAAHDDFVDVAGGWGRWVALRAGGQTISSDGRADFTGIAKIAASFNAEYAFITQAGKLVIPDDETWALPAELEQGVVDAALGMQHGIALLEGGRAVVFGARYEGVVGDPVNPRHYGTPRWPPPEARALEQVNAVAATVTHAATLHEDGSLSLWGWEGPLEWRADPRQKPLRQLRSTEDDFWALDEGGQIWRLSVPRNPAPGQPVYVTGKPSPSEAGVIHLRSRCWLRKNGVWVAHMNTKEGMALMKDAGLSERTAFSLSGGMFDGKPFASLLWIEPVEAASTR